MSIQSEIERIAGNVAAAYGAVGALGGTVPASLSSEGLAKAVGTIPKLPAGGAAGQLLAKNSGTDYDAGWKTPDFTNLGIDPVKSTDDDTVDKWAELGTGYCFLNNFILNNQPNQWGILVNYNVKGNIYQHLFWGGAYWVRMGNVNGWNNASKWNYVLLSGNKAAESFPVFLSWMDEIKAIDDNHYFVLSDGTKSYRVKAWRLREYVKSSS